MTRARVGASRRCSVPGCRGWAMRGQPLGHCRAHTPQQSAPTAPEPHGEPQPECSAGTASVAVGAVEQATAPADTTIWAGLYAGVFHETELAEIARQLQSPQRSVDMEVAIMRVMIRRVMEHCGAEDPLRALPLIRQGVDAICRALRTERVLSGESSDALAAAFATALREIAEEVGAESSSH